MKVTGLYKVNPNLFVCEKGRVPIRFLFRIKRVRFGDDWYYKMGDITAAEGSIISFSKDGKKIIFQIVGNAQNEDRFKLRRYLFSLTRVVYERVDEVLDFYPITPVLPDFLLKKDIRKVDESGWIASDSTGDIIFAEVGEGYWIYGEKFGVSVIWNTEFDLVDYSSLVVCDEDLGIAINDTRVADIVKDKNLYDLCFNE